jgi:hypothetical protein
MGYGLRTASFNKIIDGYNGLYKIVSIFANHEIFKRISKRKGLIDGWCHGDHDPAV